MKSIAQQLDEIEAQLNELEAKICTLSLEQLTWKPDPAIWSILQTVHHLVMADEILGYPREKEVTKSADFPFNLMPKGLLMNFVLRSLKNNQALPLPTAQIEPEGDATLTYLFIRWRRARQVMFNAIIKMRDNEHRFRHPVLGKLNAPKLLKLSFEHTAYHTRQIENLIQDSRFPNARGD